MRQQHMYEESQLPLQHSAPPYPDQPPPYSVDGAASPAAMGEPVKVHSKWNPKYWSTKVKLFAGAAVAALIIAIICGSYFGVKNNAYPDYKRLNYSLKDTYSGSNFFDNFNFFSDADPTNGFVQYVDAAGAEWLNLTYASSSSAVMKVDTSSDVDTSNGRRSVRITSKNQYDDGLFIFDVTHTPYGCGTWPALWLSDPDNWPENGEIDMMEGVNQISNSKVQSTLHTTNHCKMNVRRKETGKVLAKNCWNETNSNAGCGVEGTSNTMGKGFNANGGGIYALELRYEGIRIWFFGRDEVPDDITNGTAPDPSTWGEAMADFPSTNCDMGSHFRNQSIIANIALCGDWAGSEAVYSDQDSCPGTCQNYVQQNADSFKNAYWEFKSFQVYQAS